MQLYQPSKKLILTGEWFKGEHKPFLCFDVTRKDRDLNRMASPTRMAQARAMDGTLEVSNKGLFGKKFSSSPELTHDHTHTHTHHSKWTVLSMRVT